MQKHALRSAEQLLLESDSTAGCVMTKYDELVVPYTSGRLEGAHNFVLRDVCPSDFSEHLAAAFDPVAEQLTFNALDPEHAQPIAC